MEPRCRGDIDFILRTSELLHTNRVIGLPAFDTGRVATLSVHFQIAMPEIHVCGQFQGCIKSTEAIDRQSAFEDFVSDRILEHVRDFARNARRRADVPFRPISDPAYPSFDMHFLSGPVESAVIGNIPIEPVHSLTRPPASVTPPKVDALRKDRQILTFAGDEKTGGRRVARRQTHSGYAIRTCGGAYRIRTGWAG
jgi:hypothetical protein